MDTNEPSLRRREWWRRLEQIVRPVFSRMAEGRLKATMPVKTRPGNESERRASTHLEAFGRSLAGAAPWLATEAALDSDETQRRDDLRRLALRALENAVDSASPDHFDFASQRQHLVDAAFLAQGLLRGYERLWPSLDPTAQSRLIEALKKTRKLQPAFNNWLLFSATIEAFLCRVGEPWDRMRIDYALRQHEQWYLGDGAYGDGPAYHWDYYNSYVIHPMLLDALDAVASHEAAWEAMQAREQNRARRFAEIQERLVAPDGSFPPIGRSLAYRSGAFQLLAQMAWRQALPNGLPAAQAREALAAMLRRVFGPTDTFDQDGWLKIGLSGSQPSLAENYISTGSLYLCSAAFLPLGLGAETPFWKDPPQDWTSKRAWSGQDLAADHALSE